MLPTHLQKKNILRNKIENEYMYIWEEHIFMLKIFLFFFTRVVRNKLNKMQDINFL